ncbi:MAG: phosphoenolpyruvate carboxylase, partial [Proteobacteria bacterium]
MKNYSEYLGKSSIYEREVILKYQLFNSLFLGLPFDANEEIGTLLLTFTKKCSDGLSHGKTAPEIVQDFFYTIALSAEEQTKLLLKFIQFIERQVVLFDALEDAAFAKINDLRGAGTIDYLMNKVQAEGSIYSHKLQQLIFNYRTRLVLTAHPTQFYPTNVLVIIGELRDAIINNNLDLIKDLILQLGLTSFVNKDKPTPIDEAKSLIWYLEHIFYFVSADIQAKLPTVNTNLEIGFWPGGDRDGNPYVTAKVTKEVAEKLRSAITKCYLRDIHNLRKRLTFNEIEEQVDVIAKKLRLNQYSLAQELLQDLEQIIIDLNHNYLSTFTHLVQEFIIKVKLFDFYFAKIDIRQNSAIHRQVVSELLQQITPDLDYANLEEEQKINLLYTSKNSTFETNELSPLAKEIIETIQVIGEVQKMNGSAAIERYIISNTDSISSILEVQWLQSIVNKTTATMARFNIVPLFETIDDLSHAETIMEYLFNLPWYQEHLQSWNNIQTIMLGFSDGTKDGGYLMANWSIFQAKKRLSKLAAKYNIQVVFFDGRGGPPSRGGGD